MNVYDIFWRGSPSDIERRWLRFEFYECFLVVVVNVVLPCLGYLVPLLTV